MSTFHSTQGADTSSAGADANGGSSGAECPCCRELKQRVENFRTQLRKVSADNYKVIEQMLRGSKPRVKARR